MDAFIGVLRTVVVLALVLLRSTSSLVPLCGRFDARPIETPNIKHTHTFAAHRAVMWLHNGTHWQNTERSHPFACNATVHPPEVDGDIVGHLVPQLPTGLVVVQQKPGEISHEPDRVPAASQQAAIRRKTNVTKPKRKQNETKAYC